MTRLRLRRAPFAARRDRFCVEVLEQRMALAADSPLAILGMPAADAGAAQVVEALSAVSQTFQVSPTDTNVSAVITLSVNGTSVGALLEQAPGSLTPHFTGTIPVVDNGTTLSISSGTSMPLANNHGSFQPGGGDANLAGRFQIGGIVASGAVRGLVLGINPASFSLAPDGSFLATGLVVRVNNGTLDYSAPPLLATGSGSLSGYEASNLATALGQLETLAGQTRRISIPVDVALNFSGDIAPGFTLAIDVRIQGTIVGYAGSTPSIQIAGPAEGVTGEPLTYTFHAIDDPVDAGTSYQYRIDWNGDGQIDQVVSGADQVEVDHVFTQLGTATVKAFVTDVHGLSGGSAQTTTAIARWRLAADAANPARVDLIWGGKTTVDRLLFANLGGGQAIQVRDQMSQALAEVGGITGKVIIYGQGGDDVLNASFLDNPVEIHAGDGSNILIGGRGADVINAGGGNNVILGGLLSTSGPDQLRAGNGRNIFIAGPGGGSVAVGSGGNLVVGGALNQVGWDDGLYQSLRDALAIWSSAASFADRVSGLLPEINSGNISSNQSSLSIQLAAGGSDLVVVDSSQAGITGAEASDQISSLVSPLPTVDFVGPATAIVGQPVTFILSATSPSQPTPSATFTFEIIVAEKNRQTRQTIHGSSGSSFSLEFEDLGDDGGQFGIVVLATDENGQTSVAAIRGIIVLPDVV